MTPFPLSRRDTHDHSPTRPTPHLPPLPFPWCTGPFTVRDEGTGVRAKMTVVTPLPPRWRAPTQAVFSSIHKYVTENNCWQSQLVMFTGRNVLAEWTLAAGWGGPEVEPVMQKKNVTGEGGGNDVSPALWYALLFENVQKSFFKKVFFCFFNIKFA